MQDSQRQAFEHLPDEARDGVFQHLADVFDSHEAAAQEQRRHVAGEQSVRNPYAAHGVFCVREGRRGRQWVGGSGARGRLRAALAALPPERREVVELVGPCRLTHQEAAEALGISSRVAMNHMILALFELRGLLKNILPELMAERTVATADAGDG